MYPHRIRLLGPWECEPLAPPLPARRFVPPARLRDVGLAEFAGTVRLTRRFGYPGRLDDNEQVWLTFAAIAGHAALQLNEHALATEASGACEFAVKPLLLPRNRLVVTLAAGDASAGLPGDIALEVRRSAFLRAVEARRAADGTILVTGLIVGVATELLELYTLAAAQSVHYARVEATPLGQPFAVSFQPEQPVQSVRLELVCISECWYAVECPVPTAR